MKRPYEVTLLFRVLSTDDELQAALDQVIAWIEGENQQFGKVTRIDRTTFGRRKLAYEVERQREGVYIIVSVDIEPAHLPELELNLRVFTPLLRYLVIRDEDAEQERQKAARERLQARIRGEATEPDEAPAEEAAAEAEEEVEEEAAQAEAEAVAETSEGEADETANS